ncbi:MAG: DNRLRE domain-containing protein [Candidatus Promineofilum sp.]|nr:DNRLRE domain-containing protein [Promineifilum sp.]
MMSDFVFLRVSGRYIRLLIATILMAFLLIMTTGIAPAQEAAADDDYPSDAEVAATLQTIVLSETRRGDVATISIEIPVGADTFTSSNRPNMNWGSDPNLRVGFNLTQGNGAERMYLFFPVSSIPSGATIQSARLRAFLNSSSPNGDTPMGLLARFLNSPWDATTLTWANYTPSWGAEIGVGQVPATTGWIEAQITSAVQEWVSGTRANNGIMIQGDETPQQRERVFTAINANDGLHPRLIVTYDVTIDTTPPTSNVTTLPQWSPGTFTVNWSGFDNPGGSGIRHYDVQFRSNGGAWQNWQTATTALSATFTGQNNNLYEFRVRAVDIANNVEAFPNNPQASTRVDTLPPSANMNALPQFTLTSNFIVAWSGTDGGSGIAHYDVEYQVNDGPWQAFMSTTTALSGQVTGAEAGSTYGFRVRAVDRVGNVQTFPLGSQAETTISIGDPDAFIVPFNPALATQNTFVVQWIGTPTPGTAITSYDVQYRFNNGPWQRWLSQFTGTSQQFTAQDGDGSYDFQVRARDSSGHLSNFRGGPASSIAVDAQAPFITIQGYLSIVGSN